MTVILSIGLISTCFVALGVSIFFFGKDNIKGECNSAPELATEECLSQKAGLCPVEDKSGVVKMARRSSVTFGR